MSGLDENSILRPHLSRNVVEVVDVSKKFSTTRSGARRNMLNKSLRGFFGLPAKEQSLHADEFWALRNISFQLPRGKTLGILGLNGAGKTTLLNLIGGMLAPDTGTVTTAGAIGALMNLSAGLQPALSARENIIIGGAVRGWSMQETMQKYDDIVEFAELGDHMSRRLVDFSSGMRMRLAFSIAAHMNPDLLLIDEVLAVGDHRFRNKCQKKIKEVTEDASVIIVSHSVRDIRDYCDECLVLKNGEQTFYGDVETGLGLLLESYHEGSIKAGEKRVDRSRNDPKTFQADAFLSNISHSLQVDLEEGANTLSCNIEYTSLQEMNGVSVGISVRSPNSSNILTGVSTINSQGLMSHQSNSAQTIRFSANISALNPGIYHIDIMIVNFDEILYEARLTTITIPDTETLNWGPLHLVGDWEINPERI